MFEYVLWCQLVAFCRSPGATLRFISESQTTEVTAKSKTLELKKSFRLFLGSPAMVLTSILLAAKATFNGENAVEGCIVADLRFCCQTNGPEE